MTPTPSQTVGPFFSVGLREADGGGDIRVEGQLLDGEGAPVSDALIEASSGAHFARCRTDEEGAYAFVAPAAAFLELTIFARGLLRHLNTRVYLPGHEDDVPPEVPANRRRTLVAVPDGDVLRFDIHLQGEDETVFFL